MTGMTTLATGKLGKYITDRQPFFYDIV